MFKCLPAKQSNALACATGFLKMPPFATPTKIETSLALFDEKYKD